MSRAVILDTETTGLSPQKGDRVVEIACLEMIDRQLTGNKFHTYLQPYRLMSEHAFKVHGLGDHFLADKPRFTDVWCEFYEFISRAEIIAHNAQFDIGFLDHEFNLLNLASPFLENKITCTKQMAQQKYGKGGNKLDDLCDKFGINREKRVLHGALIDCEFLAEVYLKMTEPLSIAS